MCYNARVLPLSSMMSTASLFVTTNDAARILCMCDRSVRNLVAAGHLHAFRPNVGGRKYLLYTSEVIEYAKAAQKPAQDAARANIQRLRALIHS